VDIWWVSVADADIDDCIVFSDNIIERVVGIGVTY
jgi:hypothetical protein